MNANSTQRTMKKMVTRHQKCKHGIRRKVFKFKFKKIAVTATVFIFLTLALWRISNSAHLDKQIAFASEIIFTALGSRNNVELVKPQEDTTIIKGEINNMMLKDIPLIIIISSLPSNEYRRNVIRKTWAKEKHRKGAIVRFFTGKPASAGEMTMLEQESKLHEDLIVDDFEEDYYKLPLKSLRLLKWFLQNAAPETKFVAKTDDDVFVNVPNVISYLNHNVASGNYSSFIGGQVYVDTYVETDPFSKWFVPQELWDHDTKLPPFAGGPFYLMSKAVALKLFEKSQTVPLFHLEDVYITGVLGSHHLNITPVNIPNVFSTIPRSYWPTVNYFYVKYFFNARSLLSYHTYSVIELIEILYTNSMD